MKKNLIPVLLTLCLLLTAALPAYATEESTFPPELTVAANQCGDTLTWEYADGVLTVSGQGPMYDYLEGGPWSEYKEELRQVIFRGGVTYVGAYAFKDYDALETVDFGDAMYEIGMEAFRSCDGLTRIDLPQSFKVFGESSFENCENLTEIHSEGVFPSFRQNSMWNTWATIYFPADRPWDVALIQELEEAFHGRIEFLASDGTDPYVPTEPTTAPTETVAPTTEATAQPETTAAPETEPEETPPLIIAPAPVQTEATDGAATEAVETAPAEAEAVEKGPDGIVVGGIIVGAVLILAALGTLLFGKGRRGGKYSR